MGEKGAPQRREGREGFYPQMNADEHRLRLAVISTAGRNLTEHGQFELGPMPSLVCI